MIATITDETSTMTQPPFNFGKLIEGLLSRFYLRVVPLPGRIKMLILVVLSSTFLQVASANSLVQADATEKKNTSSGKDEGGVDHPENVGPFELRIVGPDGKPISNVQVELRSKVLPKPDQLKVGTLEGRGTYGLSMSTNDEGRLVFDAPRRTSDFNLFIKHPGFGPYWASWASDAQPLLLPERFIAELDAGWSVGGIILDQDGKPVEGVVVHPSIEFKKRPGDNRQLSIGDRAKTDASGRWRFENVPVSKPEVHVEINHPDFRPDRRSLTRPEFGIDAGKEPVAKIVLDRGLTVTGTITDDSGKPISGALIRTKFLNDVRQAKSAEDGTYRLRACEPVEAALVVSAAGRAIDMKEVRISPDMAPVDFQLQPGGKVRLRVVDQKGQPVPKARIFFQRWRGDRYSYFEFGHVNQYADDKGIWEWNEAPLDEFKADICPPDGITLPMQTIVAREEEYVFKTYPPLVITGRVIDAETGKPIEAFQVLPGVRGDESHMNWVEGQRFKATDGKFTLRHRHGYFAHLVRLEASGYLPAVSRDIKNDEGDVAIEFELRKGKDVLAKVVDQKLQPVEGAKVALGVAGSQISIVNGDIDGGSTYATQLKTDEAGKFRFPPQDKDFQLLITHPSGFAHIKSTPDWPQLKIIRLEPWARVEGTFRVGTATVGNVPITINTLNPHSYGKDVASIFTHHDLTTGPGGEFVFERVFPGKASIGRRMMLSGKDGATEVTSTCMIHADFPEGTTSRIELGGTGRPAIGTLIAPEGFEGPIEWNFALVEVHVKDDDRDHPGPYFFVSVDRNGKFRIEDMPAGEYTLTVSFSKNPPGFLNPRQFAVPAFEGKRTDTPVELGTLKLIKR